MSGSSRDDIAHRLEAGDRPIGLPAHPELLHDAPRTHMLGKPETLDSATEHLALRLGGQQLQDGVLT
jgi:hypothetical protein